MLTFAKELIKEILIITKMKRLLLSTIAMVMMGNAMAEMTTTIETSDAQKSVAASASQNSENPYRWLSEELLTVNDLAQFSKAELRFLRYAIYAQHEYKFLNQNLISYFMKYNWYRPMYRNISDKLTTIEKANVSTIIIAEDLLDDTSGALSADAMAKMEAKKKAVAVKEIALVDWTTMVNAADKKSLSANWFSNALKMLNDNAQPNTDEPYSDVRALLSSKAVAIQASELLQYKKVRTHQIFTNSGLVSYDFFGCKFYQEGKKLMFNKTGGSQRLYGEISRKDNNHLVITGARYLSGVTPSTYSDPRDGTAGIIKKVSADKVVMLCRMMSGGYELYEFSK